MLCLAPTVLPQALVMREVLILDRYLSVNYMLNLLQMSISKLQVFPFSLFKFSLPEPLKHSWIKITKNNRLLIKQYDRI